MTRHDAPTPNVIGDLITIAIVTSAVIYFGVKVLIGLP